MFAFYFLFFKVINVSKNDPVSLALYFLKMLVPGVLVPGLSLKPVRERDLRVIICFHCPGVKNFLGFRVSFA